MRPKRGCGYTLVSVVGVALVVLIAAGAGFQWVNVQPWFCDTCHEMDFHYQSWQLSTHREPVECLDCHASPGVAGFIEEKVRGAEQVVAHFTGDYPVPIRILVRVRNEECLACHPDAATLPDLTVDARHDVHAAAGVLCADCHSRLVHNQPDEPKVISLAQCEGCHQNHTTFSMVGAHAVLNCSACHTGGDYAAISTACESCHPVPDGHPVPVRTNCAGCHTPSGWEPARTDHHLFALTGKHTEAACEGCHPGARYEGTPSTCESCHQVPAQHIPGITSGCAECHTPDGWRPASFDHSFFPLIGQHAALACAQCHPSGQYAGTGNLCENCHSTPADHPVGQVPDCGSCHTPEAWSPARFDHTGLPLSGAHAFLACTSCHTSGVFRGLGAACASCHSAPSTHAGLSSNCASCHSTGSFSPSTFHHPQVGEHIPSGEHRLACNDCHTKSFGQATCTKCHGSNNPRDD